MRIVKNGDVHVSAPIGIPKSEVERFIEEHRDWIAQARKKTSESQSSTISCRLRRKNRLLMPFGG